MNSKRLTINSRVLSKFNYNVDLICFLINLALRRINKISIKQDQISSEATVPQLNWPLTQLSTKNGAPLSVRLIQTQETELSQMLYRDLMLLIVNLITHLKKLIEEAQSLVVFKLMLNCLMRLHGRLKVTYTPTLLEQSTGTDIINQNLSINLCFSTLTAE